MGRFRILSLVAFFILLSPTISSICPTSCRCNTTQDGLHRAICSNLTELYKFTQKQKHHNINILDLSHNNITKLNHELDSLSEVVTLDLSTNGIIKLNKFLNNAKKLVHLNLANNRIRELMLTNLPKSVSSLDLSNNLLQNVPSNVEYLSSLEHLELKGNPIECNCKNIKARNQLLAANVLIDNVRCIYPAKLKGKSWLKLELKNICKEEEGEINDFDMMMGDQPIDPVSIANETSELQSPPLKTNSVLDDVNVIHSDSPVEDEDSLIFMRVGKKPSLSATDDIEGSGEEDSTTISSIDLSDLKLKDSLIIADDNLYTSNTYATEDPIEGSGEGSGFGIVDYIEPVIETTIVYEELNPGPVHKLFEDDINSTTTEFPTPKIPSVYQGGTPWIEKTESTTSEKPSTPPLVRDTTISEPIRITHASEVLEQSPPTEEKQVTHKTGTYICIAIIVILLVGLIGFAIIKGQIRKRRDRRLLRQQKRDVEKASKEMVDMNKSLLGKPAGFDNPPEKKLNGKYELVPTHESHQKKSGENGDVSNGVKPERNGVRTDSPRDTNQNKSSSRDHNLMEDNQVPAQETSFDYTPDVPEVKKDSQSLSSEDVFVPIGEEEVPKYNGNIDSDLSHIPLINGDQNTDSDILSPSREYVPVYSPDMGRVRIKLSETPKPKTPVLVTRSRSNAGDIIITPSADGNVRNSAT